MRSFTLTLLSLAFVCAGCAPSSSEGGAADKPADDRPGPARVCTEIGCSDQATVTATSTAGDAPTGTHTFEITLDDAVQTCTVEITDPRERGRASCSGEAELSLGPVTRGVEEQVGATVSYHEEPVPGQWQWQLDVIGTPGSVRVVHRHADAVLVDQTATFEYAEHRPNGDGCEPVCKAASVAWTVP